MTTPSTRHLKLVVSRPEPLGNASDQGINTARFDKDTHGLLGTPEIRDAFIESCWNYFEEKRQAGHLKLPITARDCQQVCNDLLVKLLGVS